jgi:hypothetical protein
MSTYTNIPTVSFTTPFGKVDKIIWFNVENTYGNFNVNFYLDPSQTNDINIMIFNYSSKRELFVKKYNKTPNTATIIETVKLTHVPNNMSTIYGLKIF